MSKPQVSVRFQILAACFITRKHFKSLREFKTTVFSFHLQTPMDTNPVHCLASSISDLEPNVTFTAFPAILYCRGPWGAEWWAPGTKNVLASHIGWLDG